MNSQGERFTWGIGGSRKLCPITLQNYLILNTSGRDQKGTELFVILIQYTKIQVTD